MSNKTVVIVRIFVLLLFLSCKDTEVKNNKNSFEVYGKIEPTIDTINLYPGFIGKQYLDSSLYNLKSKIVDGNFNIMGKVHYPHMFNFHSPKIGVSDPVFIEDGKSEISLKFNNGKRLLEVSELSKSPSQREYEAFRDNKLNPVYRKMKNSESKEEYNNLKSEIDTILTDYAKQNPNSYMAFWLLLDKFCRNGSEYNELYEKSLDYFSNEIRELHSFKVFRTTMEQSKNFSFENFSIPLKDINRNDVVFNLNNYYDKNNYLLIDFWFAKCKPCLIEMEEYKPIYDKYRIKGFEIISVAAETPEDVSNWSEVIDKKDFNWEHYLDLGGLETRKLNILKFPTTFLIDKKGRILKKDITPKELQVFLDESFK